MNMVNTKQLVQGTPIYLIGGGPSAKSFNMESIQDKNVIAINHAMYYFNKPHHIIYYGDQMFENTCHDYIKNHPSEHKYTKLKHSKISTHVPVATSNNSGTQAIQLCQLLDVSHIYLIGFDMQLVNGESHWHGMNFCESLPHHYKEFKQDFDSICKDLEIPITVLT